MEGGVRHIEVGGKDGGVERVLFRCGQGKHASRMAGVEGAQDDMAVFQDPAQVPGPEDPALYGIGLKSFGFGSSV